MKFSILLLSAVLAAAQDHIPQPSVSLVPQGALIPQAAPAPNPPSDTEQQDLMHAVNESSTSPVDAIRVFEAFLKKYPNSAQRRDIERGLLQASFDMKDNERAIKYGERVLEATPEDGLALDRVAYALLAVGGKENAEKAVKYARKLEDIIDKLPHDTGKNAVAIEDDREHATARVLLYQARGRTMMDEKEAAERLASRAFDTYSDSETARAWADVLVAMGRNKDAVARLADAFAIPDPRSSDPQRMTDRIRLGELYAKVTNPERSLGDEILAAYDRTSAQVEIRRKKILALDPNSAAGSPLDFTVTGIDGKKLQLASLKGKVIVMDFWATWCGPCRIQHPMYEEVKKHYNGREDVVFLSLDADDDRTLVAPFLAEQKWETPSYFEDGLGRIMQVVNIPTTILFNKKAKISSRMNGFLPDTFIAQLIERIDAALTE